MTISSLAGSAIGGPGFKRVMESPFDMLCIAFPRWADGLIRLLGPILWKHGYKERGESTFWYLEKPEITYDGVTGAPNCNPNVWVPGPYRLAYIKIPKIPRFLKSR